MSINKKTDNLSEDKQVLLSKLSSIFDSRIATDFVCPKTYETRKVLTIEDLQHVNTEQTEERLERLRTMVHYENTTQSLARADLEASYHAFVRGQLGQEQCSREELEQFVRNSSDIDAAKRYFDSGQNTSAYPLQSHLLYQSSKLNEQRANLLKSASTRKSLKDMNESFTLHEYFPETLMTPSKKTRPKQREIVEQHKTLYSHPQSMHVEHRDKKYRITFLKDSNTVQYPPKLVRYTNNHANLFLRQHRTAESLFGTDSSTVHGPSTDSHTSNIHREIFPPLSLSALREYRPTLIPQSPSASTARTDDDDDAEQSSSRRAMTKSEFIWEQSIVSSQT